MGKIKVKKYGLPYKGSKSRIVDALAEAIPYKGVDNFYDVFAGGCAVTHKMLLEMRYKRYFCNDLDGYAMQLFCDMWSGKKFDDTRWIGREDFFREKDSDAYVRLCWSFGNDGRTYMYGKTIEPYKKACHYAIVLDDWSVLKELCPEVWEAAYDALKGVTDRHERRIKFGPAIVRWLKANGNVELIDSNPLYRSCHTRKDTKTRPKGAICDLERLERLERLQRLESLESLQSLESLERLQRLQRLESVKHLTMTKRDYREMEFLPNSVLYNDIPYKGTNQYGINKKDGFDYEAFYDWCEAQTNLVLISEYDMPEDRFTGVWNIQHRSTLNDKLNQVVTERLFVPNGQLQMYNDLMSLQREEKEDVRQLTLFD